MRPKEKAKGKVKAKAKARAVHTGKPKGIHNFVELFVKAVVFRNSQLVEAEGEGPIEKAKPTFVKLKDVKPGTRSYDLIVQVWAKPFFCPSRPPLSGGRCHP